MQKDALHLHLYAHLPQRTRVWMAVHIIAVITLGLLLDIRLGWTGQHAATLWTVAVFAWLYALGRKAERRVLVFCLLIAGFGEVVLSLVWGIYDYQFHNVPLFVPPGHALLMTLGLLTCPMLGSRGVKMIALLGTLWAMYAGVRGFDQFGVVVYGLFLTCLFFGPAKSLYATMFVLALIMELYGTALGNWEWSAAVPGLGWTAANPPFSAGAFYCLLDLLVLSVLRALPATRDAAIEPRHL